MRATVRWVAAGLLTFGLSAAAGPSFAQHAGDASQPLRVTSVTPSGSNVPVGRQIIIQFNRPVVPIGRMERDSGEIPIRIVPALSCQWRWIDPTALACQLGQEEGFAPATRYEVVIEPGIRAEDGATIAQTRSHVFITERPRVEYASFSTWRGPGTPVIRLIFNQPVSQSSVRDHLLIAAGAAERHTIAIEPDEHDRELPRFLRLPGEGVVLDFGGPQTDSSDDRPTRAGAEEARRIWLVSPTDELPADTRAQLRVEPGLRSAEGPEAGDENRIVVEFDTFPEYHLLGIVCESNTGEDMLIENGADGSGAFQAEGCSPLRGVGLAFSAPTIDREVRDHVTIAPDLAGGRADYDPWANAYEYSRLGSPHRRGRRYVVWLPNGLKAAAAYRIATGDGSGPRDEFGRELAVPIALEFRTDHRPPDYTIVHSTAVIESGIDSEVPLYVTNLDRATLDYRRLTAAGGTGGLTVTRDLPAVEDVQYGVPLGVREMLGGQTGAVYGHVSTTPAVAKYAAKETFFAQVTPYQVHAKIGHFNTLVWVTELATGAPVADAAVSIYVDRLVDLSPSLETLAAAKTDAQGIALLAGTRELDPGLDLSYGCSNSDFDTCPRLFVRVEQDGRMALLPLQWRFEVSPYRVSNYTVFNRTLPKFGHLHSWGTTAQGVYRAGDTIDFKIYVRDQSNETYVEPPVGRYSLEIIDPTGKPVHTVENIGLSAFGAFSGAYRVPETAAVGWYQFKLDAGFAADVTRFPMRVLVSDFTPASFRVATSLNGDRFAAGSEVTAETRAELFSGGPYRDAEARVTATIASRPFRSQHPLAAGFRFDGLDGPRTVNITQYTAAVGESGELRHRFEIPPGLGEQLVYGTLSVEGAVRDDRGRYVANSASARFLAVDRLVGLKNSRWTYAEDEPAAIEFVVVDAEGVPTAGTDVEIDIERLDTKAARVKGAGNAYLTEFVNEWVEVASCQRVSAATPGDCEFIPGMPGRYRARARIADTQGRAHATEIGAWVIGKGQVVWNTDNDDQLEIVPEQTTYRIGDTARYLIQNPYPGARALVTVERYGVLKQWTETFASSTPVLELEIEKDFMPGFYLSVLLVSPRVDAPAPEFGEVDLGKPAFKMGYVSVPVADPYKQLDIEVKVEGERFKPHDTVRVKVDARPLNREQSEPIEAAVVVLDEAVLDLIQGGTSYYDPYAGFNELDGLDVRNFGLLTRLVGRQRIELKGANAGGDGGAALSMRSIFKYVGYWNPSLVLDRRGRGEFEFTLPDNLTGWRVLVLGVTPTDRMGLGQAQFTVNLPTEIRPVMPNQVTEGDHFLAGFSVMNRTEAEREIRVRIEAAGDTTVAAPHEATIHLPPYKRETVFMPLDAARLAPDRNFATGRIRFDVSARDAGDGDALEHTLPVLKQRSLQTAASYGSIVEEPAAESLRFPEPIRTDVGEVGVDLSASVIGNVEGAFRYMRDYPYTSWEQRLSKAVMASHYGELAPYLGGDFQWPESATLPNAMLAQAANFQAPNGGMSYFIPLDQFVSPYLSAYTALALNWLARAGFEIPEAVEAKLHDYLDSLLKRDVVPDFYTRGMASTVRAVALAALAEHGEVTLADVARYREHVEYMSLFGKAHFVMAALAVDGGRPMAREVLEAIMRSAVRSAGKLSFNEQLDDGYYRILTTPMRANCAVLSALAAGDETGGAEGKLELVRTITETRGNRDHWENTQENMFCMNALIDYARRYESVEPALEAVVAMDGATIGRAAFASVRDKRVSIVRPITADDPGRASLLQIRRNGTGRLYYAARMSYASTAEASSRVNAGADVRRELSVERDGEWVLLEDPATIARGELVRVDLFVSLPTARHFLVVDDPVPGGLEPVNRDLANASAVDADAGAYEPAGSSWWFQYGDWHNYNVSRWSFHHRELRHDAARFYSDYLPPGNYHLSYTAQAIAEGDFKRMSVRAEEMYDPDVYGIGVPGTLSVSAPATSASGGRTAATAGVP